MPYNSYAHRTKKKLMEPPRLTPEIQTLYEKKQAALLELFAYCKTAQEIYEKIITLGKSVPKPLKNISLEENRILGCQSIVHLSSEIDFNGKVFYEINSDALISSGLAYLLLFIYSGEQAELILFCPPLFIQKLQLTTNLSPGRSNGLASMYVRMKQDALKLFIQKNL